MKFVIYFLLSISFISSGTGLEAIQVVKAQLVKEKQLGFHIGLLNTVIYNSSIATDINDKGEIVGTFTDFFDKSYATEYAFYISTEGQLHILDLPGHAASGLRINNNSQIIGNFVLDGYNRSFFWDPIAGLEILETFSNGKSTWARDINDQGLIVGSSETGDKSTLDSYSINVRHACIWKNKKIHDLGTLKTEQNLEGDMSEAICINNLGEIVGTSNYAINLGGKKKKSNPKPFFWDGTMQEIPYGDDPVAINNNSNVIVNTSGGVLGTCIIWNPRKNVIYSINHTRAVDINDLDVVLFPYASNQASWPLSNNKNEVTYYSNGKVYLYTTFICKNQDMPLQRANFSRINNRNQIVGTALPEEINESHSCILNPINTILHIK